MCARVRSVFKRGRAEVAREAAAQTLAEVKKAMRIDYFADRK